MEVFECKAWWQLFRQGAKSSHEEFPGAGTTRTTRCRLRRRGIGSKLLRNLCCDAEKSGFQKLSRLVKLPSQKQSSCGSSFTINL